MGTQDRKTAALDAIARLAIQSAVDGEEIVETDIRKAFKKAGLEEDYLAIADEMEVDLDEEEDDEEDDPTDDEEDDPTDDEEDE